MKLMKKAHIFAIVCLGIGVLNAQGVWLVDSLQRVGPFDAPGAALNISLYSAKAESESFQVVVRAPATGLSNINLTTSGLTGPSGATIPPADFTFYREYYVEVNNSSPDFGTGNRPLGAGWYPDALIPFKNPVTGLDVSGAIYDAVPFTLAANQNQPFWIDINVPRDTAAGDYTGTVVVSSSQGSVAVNVTLTVWNFALPATPRLKSSFGFHNGWGTLANNEVLLQHRIQPFIVTPQELPILQPLGLELVGLPFFNESSGCRIETPPAVSVLSSAVGAYPPGFPTYVYPADEVSGCPNLVQNLQTWAQAAHGAGAKVLVTTPPDFSLFDDGTGQGRSAVDIWVMLPKQYCLDINQTPCVARPAISAALGKGDEIWFYDEQEQDDYSPKWLIDFAPINYRIMPGFMNQRFGFTGMLYSDVAHWGNDRWNDVEVLKSAGYSYPGDDVLVYPGQQAGYPSVVPSMRLKFIRDGVDDFDYIAMLKDLGQGALVDQILSTIAPDWQNWTKDTAALQAARIRMGQELDRLAGGSAEPATPLPPTNPWPFDGTLSPATSLHLQCSSVPGVNQYQFYLGTSSTNLPLWASVTSTGPVVRLAVYKLVGATTYYWKVVATNGVSSTSGPVWSFQTP